MDETTKMRWIRNSVWLLQGIACGVLVLATATGQAGTLRAASCQKIVLIGEVIAGQEWKAEIGQGWVFRVMPIGPASASYSGWDLVVDRDQPAGYPDALLVATPPFNSINEREVGTSYGLRAQDAIGWNPRSFRFLTNPAAFRQVQAAYLEMSRNRQLGPGEGASSGSKAAAGSQPDKSLATAKLMESGRESSPGQFRILDAKLTPGVSDAAPYAETWAVQSMRTPQTYESTPGAKPTPLGQLHWIRFSVTLWLPEAWKAPAQAHAVRAGCSE
jgi:hypothetical protein